MSVKSRLGTVPNNFQNFQRSNGMTSKDDARFRLIQKKREKITDARERISEIAKYEDARKKLDKIRSQNGTSIAKEKVSNVVVKKKISMAGFGNQLQTRTVSKSHTANSKGISSLANLSMHTGNRSSSFIGVNKPRGVLQGKTQMKAGSLTRTVNSGISNLIVKKQPTTVNRTTSDRYHPLPNNPNVVTIRNDNIDKPVIDRRNQRLANLPQLKAKRILQKAPTSRINSSGAGISRQSGSSRNGLQLMKTIKGDSYNPYQGSPSHSYIQEIKPARLKITTPNNYVDYEAPDDNDRYRMPPTSASSTKRNSYDDYDLHYSPPKKPALSNSIISRLDQSQQTSSGYKVMVTNLHPVVTREDIEELFGNIGSIRYARMVREGISEVVFHEKEDAYRSVEVYHNRQLDGQAMSVTVVTKVNEMAMSSTPYDRYSPASRSNYSPPRPFLPPPPPPPPQPRRTGHTMTTSQLPSRPKSVLRTAGGSEYGNHCSALSVPNKRLQKLDVAPDIHAIHHALFSGRSSGGYHHRNSDPQVVIKLPKQPFRGGK